MIREVSLSILFLWGLNRVCAQKEIGAPILDSTKVAKIAKWRNAYWQGPKSPTPVLKWEPLQNEWLVLSSRIRHINRGYCKYTNGCTEITSMCLVLDAYSGQVKSKTKEKKRYYNYE
jgi:hypothetical protein